MLSKKFYEVVNAPTWPLLVAEVNSMCQHGWRPLGAPILSHHHVESEEMYTMTQALCGDGIYTTLVDGEPVETQE